MFKWTADTLGRLWPRQAKCQSRVCQSLGRFGAFPSRAFDRAEGIIDSNSVIDSATSPQHPSTIVNFTLGFDLSYAYWGCSNCSSPSPGSDSGVFFEK